MKEITKHNNLFLKTSLLLFPLIPYNIIVPEVINPLMFLTLSILFIFQIRDRLDKKDIYWILLFLISFISYIISKDKVIVFMNSFNTTIIIIAYFFGKKLKKDELIDVFSFIFYGGMLNATLSIFRYLGYSDSRLDGILNYANSSAIYFAVCLIIYIYTLQQSTINYSNDIKFSFDGNKIKELGAIIIGSAIFLTQSRAAIIIYGFTLIYIFIIFGRINRKLIIDIVFLNLSALILAYLLLNRKVMAFHAAIVIIIWAAHFKEKINLKDIKNKYRYTVLFIAAALFIVTILISFKRIINIGINSGELQERFVFFQDGINILKHNLLGIGSGMLSSEQFKYQSALYDVKYIHNGILQIGIDFGVIFLLLFMLLLCLNLFKGINKEKAKSLYFIIVMIIILHSLIDFTMSFIYIDIIFGLALGGLSVNDEDVNYNIKIINISFKILLATVSVIIALLLPGEIIYNISYVNLINNNPEKSLSNLQLWSKFPVKSERYYNKKSLIYYLLYLKDHNKNHIMNSINNSIKAIKFNEGYGVDYALLASLYSELGDNKKAAQSLEKQIQLKKFYINNYDSLIETYHKLYYAYAITGDEYFNKVKQIESKILNLRKIINPKFKYMKNQPNGKLNNFELVKIAEAYMIVNDVRGYFKYLNLVDKNSYEYKDYMNK